MEESNKNQSYNKLKVEKFDLGEINGGWQKIICEKAISETEYYVVTLGLPPKDEVLKNIRNQSIVDYGGNIINIQNKTLENENFTEYEFFLKNIPRRNSIYRCFKLTKKEKDKYKFEEFVAADSIAKIGDICGIVNILGNSITECLTDEEALEILAKISNFDSLSSKNEEETFQEKQSYDNDKSYSTTNTQNINHSGKIERLHSFDLDEMYGGTQTIIDFRAISPTEYCVITLGEGPKIELHPNIDMKILKKEYLERQKIKKDTEEENKEDEGNVKIRFFKLTMVENNRYAVKEYVTPEAVAEIAQLFIEQN